MEAPKPEEYGLTPERLEVVDRQLWRVRMVASVCVGLVVGSLGFMTIREFFASHGSRDLMFDTLMIALPLSIFLTAAGGMAFFLLLLSLPVALWDEHGKFRRYHAAVAVHEKWLRQSQVDFWTSTPDSRLQHQVLDLYRRMGYEVLPRPAGAPECVDFVMKKEDMTVLINCRPQARQVDWMTPRDLVEACKLHKADRAVVVSIPGYTANAKRFATNRAVGLLSVAELANIRSRVEARERAEALSAASV